MKTIWLFICFIYVPGTIFCYSWQSEVDGEFSASISFPLSVTIPNKATIELVLTYPQNYHTSLDNLKKSLLDYPKIDVPPFKLLSAGSIKENISETLIREKYLFVLEPQIPGTFLFTFKKIEFFPDDTNEKTFFIISDIFSWEFLLPEHVEIPKSIPLMLLNKQLPITLNAHNQSQINRYDLQILEAKRNEEIFSRKAFPWIELILILLLVIFITSSKYVPKQVRPELSLDEQRKIAKKKALKKLKKIEGEISPEKFYVVVTDTVRHYIEENYKLHASTQTTAEFLNEASKSPDLSKQTRSILSQFLMHADQVKFALHAPSEMEKRETWQAAEKIISEDL